MIGIAMQVKIFDGTELKIFADRVRRQAAAASVQTRQDHCVDAQCMNEKRAREYFR
jgi:hypothetical protein